MQLQNKIVWITGASSGIGRQAAIDFAKANCKLILSARNVDQLEETRRLCAVYTPHVEIVPLDLQDTDAMPALTERSISCFGHIDILFHCGGVSQRSLIADTSIDVDRKIMEVDYLGAVALSKSILPHFVSRKNGLFVVISSVMGKYGSPYRSGYCGAKHALHGFFDAMRMEHEKDGIRVTIVCPGFVNTNVTRNALTGDGTALNHQDQKTEEGLTVESFSKKMMRAIKNESFEVYIGGKEAWAVYIKRFFPRLLHRMVMKSKVR